MFACVCLFSEKIYTVNVKTGDKSGCGTNANVFLTMMGDRGDTGERKLAKSETNFDKFEKNQVTLKCMKLDQIKWK